MPRAVACPWSTSPSTACCGWWRSRSQCGCGTTTGSHQLDGNLLPPIVFAVVLQGCLRHGHGSVSPKVALRQLRRGARVALTAASVGVVLTVGLWQWHGIPRSVPALAMGCHCSARFRRGRCGACATSVAVARTATICSGWWWWAPARAASRSCARCVARTIRRICRWRCSTTIRTSAICACRACGSRVGRRSGGGGPKYHADAVLIAVPSADSSFIRRVSDLADKLKLRVLVLPPVDQLLGGVGESDIRPVNELDLLGRHPADIDPEAVAQYITGRRVLVTGAGGSIGSELCRQLARFEPAKLFMLDRDESGLHGTQLSIEGRAMLDDDTPDPGRHPRRGPRRRGVRHAAGPRWCSTPRR
jgi:hypothetical protein